MLSPRQASDVLQGLESALETILQAHATGIPAGECRDLYRGLGAYLAILRTHFEAPGKKGAAKTAASALISR
jgi:hypothetical protein